MTAYESALSAVEQNGRQYQRTIKDTFGYVCQAYYASQDFKSRSYGADGPLIAFASRGVTMPLLCCSRDIFLRCAMSWLIAPVRCCEKPIEGSACAFCLGRRSR
jgi:hypothetical protein